MNRPTPADIAAWTGDATAAAPLAAATAATLTVNTSAFPNTDTAKRMNAIVADARTQLMDAALHGFRQIGGEAAERHIAARNGVRYPA